MAPLAKVVGKKLASTLPNKVWASDGWMDGWMDEAINPFLPFFSLDGIPWPVAIVLATSLSTCRIRGGMVGHMSNVKNL